LIRLIAHNGGLGFEKLPHALQVAKVEVVVAWGLVLFPLNPLVLLTPALVCHVQPRPAKNIKSAGGNINRPSSTSPIPYSYFRKRKTTGVCRSDITTSKTVTPSEITFEPVNGPLQLNGFRQFPEQQSSRLGI
jgi:hypothetical protein